jgi:F-box/WD-40 domain protein MET30
VYGLRQINLDLLASSSYDTSIRVWNVTSGELMRTLVGHTSEILWSIDLLNDDSQVLVSGSYDQTIKMWNFTTGECLNTFRTGLYINVLVMINFKKVAATTGGKLKMIIQMPMRPFLGFLYIFSHFYILC